MDRVKFDVNGDAHVQITAVPQSVGGGGLGILPVSVFKKSLASSAAGCCYSGFAFDDCTHTWWMPAEQDNAPWLEVDLCQKFTISAFQVIWAEEGLDYRNGVTPEPAIFKVEFLDNDRETVLATADYTDNTRDLLVDFRQIEPVRSRYVRLSFVPASNPLLHRGVNNFTLFGKR